MIKNIVDIEQNTAGTSWRLEETCCHLIFIEKPSALVDGKKSQKSNGNVQMQNYGAG